jgi:hypothetical protein
VGEAHQPGGRSHVLTRRLVCTVETYRDKVKVTFAKGASLSDPHGLFNASMDAGTRRAIDTAEGDALDEDAFVELVRDAVRRNRA